VAERAHTLHRRRSGSSGASLQPSDHSPAASKKTAGGPKAATPNRHPQQAPPTATPNRRPRQPPTHLDHEALVLKLPRLHVLEHLARRKDGAAAGRRVAPQAAVQVHGLAGDHAWAEALVGVFGLAGCVVLCCVVSCCVVWGD